MFVDIASESFCDVSWSAEVGQWLVCATPQPNIFPFYCTEGQLGGIFKTYKTRESLLSKQK